MKIKIGYNARILHSEHMRGWNRYTVELLKALLSYNVVVYLYTDRSLADVHIKQFEGLGSFKIRHLRGESYDLWEQGLLPWAIFRDKIDLFHSPYNFGLPLITHCPTVLTIHDAIDWVFYRKDRSFLKKINPQGLRSDFRHWMARRRADKIITVSEHAKHDLMDTFSLDKDDIEVIYEAQADFFNQPIDPNQTKKILNQYSLNNPYFLYVGGFDKRKNVPFLIEAFSMAKVKSCDLALVGAINESERKELLGLCEKLGVTQQVKFLGFVEDEKLPVLYSNAYSLVIPSSYEGFGLQLCEAFACGCAVICSNKSSLPEILSEGGKLFSLEDPRDLAQLIYHVAMDESLRESLKKKSKQRAKDFSWTKTAEKTFALYRDIIVKKRRAI